MSLRLFRQRAFFGKKGFSPLPLSPPESQRLSNIFPKALRLLYFAPPALKLNVKPPALFRTELAV
jgi:hypothetical protein